MQKYYLKKVTEDKQNYVQLYRVTTSRDVAVLGAFMMITTAMVVIGAFVPELFLVAIIPFLASFATASFIGLKHYRLDKGADGMRKHEEYNESYRITRPEDYSQQEWNRLVMPMMFNSKEDNEGLFWLRSNDCRKLNKVLQDVDAVKVVTNTMKVTPMLESKDVPRTTYKWDDDLWSGFNKKGLTAAENPKNSFDKNIAIINEYFNKDKRQDTWKAFVNVNNNYNSFSNRDRNNFNEFIDVLVATHKKIDNLRNSSGEQDEALVAAKNSLNELLSKIESNLKPMSDKFNDGVMTELEVNNIYLDDKYAFNNNKLELFNK